MPASYLSPKTRIGRSPIHGRGLFATRPIRKDEIVAIKGGHILDRRTLSKVRRRIAAAYIQIDDGFYIGAIRGSEVGRNKIYINHSCEPNLGFRGQLTFVALRAIKAGEELTYDWAMEENVPARTRCACGGATLPEGAHGPGLEEGGPAETIPRLLLDLPPGQDHEATPCTDEIAAPTCRR